MLSRGWTTYNCWSLFARAYRFSWYLLHQAR